MRNERSLRESMQVLWASTPAATLFQPALLNCAADTMDHDLKNVTAPSSHAQLYAAACSSLIASGAVRRRSFHLQRVCDRISSGESAECIWED
jgi:hypothetical protein